MCMFLVHIGRRIPVLFLPSMRLGAIIFTYWGLLAASSVTYTELDTARCYSEDKMGEWK